MYKYDLTLMKVAMIQAELSYCIRAKVGAVIARDDRIISTGYNGNPTKASNDCEETIKGLSVTKSSVIHAEANAILFCARSGISTNECTLYITLSPCMECSKMILQSGIKRVVFLDSYKGDVSTSFLEKNGIIIEKLKEKNDIPR